MNRLCFVAAVALAVGCSNGRTPRETEILCECFSESAYEVIRAEIAVAARPAEPKACCKECKGTGRVKSGDGISWVACPCPDTCECKKQAGCKGGTCKTTVK